MGQEWIKRDGLSHTCHNLNPLDFCPEGRQIAVSIDLIGYVLKAMSH